MNSIEFMNMITFFIRKGCSVSIESSGLGMLSMEVISRYIDMERDLYPRHGKFVRITMEELNFKNLGYIPSIKNKICKSLKIKP